MSTQEKREDRKEEIGRNKLPAIDDATMEEIPFSDLDDVAAGINNAMCPCTSASCP